MADKTFDKIILGIDPGTNIMGYGLVGVKDKKAQLIDMNVFNLSKIDGQPLKLKKIFEETLIVIEKFLPDEMAIEAPFFGKNVQSMLKLGRAQGVVYAAALSKGIPVEEYSPRKIKQSVTGNGNASKEQVSAMVKNYLQIKSDIKFLDATDAAAVALCHYFQGNTISTGKKSYSSWTAFVKTNPEKTKK